MSGSAGDVFPAVEAATWIEAAVAALGREHAPCHHVEPGIEVDAVKKVGTGPSRLLVSRTQPVRVGQAYGGGTPTGACLEALRLDAQHGLEIAWIDLDAAVRRGHGTADAEVLDALLAAAHPASIVVDAGVAAPGLWLARAGSSVVADPLGTLVRFGGLAVQPRALWAAMRTSDAHLGHARALVCGAPYHDAGASIAAELGAVIASVIETVRHAGVEVWPRMIVRLVADSRVFVTMAKVRALHWLLAGLGKRWGVSPGLSRPRVVVQTSWRERARMDEANNLVRATLEVFAAIAGGAQDVIIQPHDAANGPGSAHSRRWALNVGHILLREAGVGHVLDPARGAPYVEALTEALARRGWAFAQDIEGRGGMLRALGDGWVQAQVARDAARMEAAFAQGEAVLTGVNVYPDPRPLAAISSHEEDEPESVPLEALRVSPLRPRRWADPFERKHSDDPDANPGVER